MAEDLLGECAGPLRRLICPSIHLHNKARGQYDAGHALLAPTRALVEDLKDMRGDDRVSIWGRGIDAQHFRPDRRDNGWRHDQGIADDEMVILFLGRLALEKGIETFAAVVRRLQNTHCRVRALVVGAGPAETAFAGLGGTIFTGHLSGGDLAKAIASADIMLSPSTTETFGNVILEALASGLPVVSADAQNSHSILTDGSDGFICPPTDIDAYVDRLAALIENDPMRQAMGRSARLKSLSYSWDIESKRVVQVYRGLGAFRTIGQRGPGLVGPATENCD